MPEMLADYKDLSPEVRGWAKNKLAGDREYLEHRAQFAPEPTRSIARLILAIADPKAVNTSGKL